MLVVAFAISPAAVAQNQSQPTQPQASPQDQSPGAVQGHSQPPGQQAAPAKPQQPPTVRPLRPISELVLVPVTVKNSAGQLVGDLTKDEFRIFEDGREQQIGLFSTDPVPLSVVVLIDNDMVMKARDQVQKSLESIAAALGPDDEAALMLFDEFPEPVLDFTKDNDAFFTKLRRLHLGDEYPGDAAGPTTAPPSLNNQSQLPQVPIYGMEQEKVVKDLDDAVHAAGELLRTRDPRRERRKMIFLIADGQNSHHNKWTFNQNLQLLLSSDVSVYTITVGSTPFIKHEPAHMSHYALDTGGDAYFAAKGNDLEHLYSRVTEEARNQYTLTYQPLVPMGGTESPAAAVGDYHTIEVRVERPGVIVNARQGYYRTAPPPAH
jgi:VWFA-related protein